MHKLEANTQQAPGITPKGWHSRGYLPHFDGGEMAQNITFRLFDSLPQSLVRRCQEELNLIPQDKQDTYKRLRIEKFLDRGVGSCWLSQDNVANIVEDTLLHFDGWRYRLNAWVVMPNHVHVLITPIAGHSIRKILHSWKSFTAKQANTMLGRHGHFWQEDYFDRLIRDEQHYRVAIEYIENNPVKASLCSDKADWKFSSAWRK